MSFKEGLDRFEHDLDAIAFKDDMKQFKKDMKELERDMKQMHKDVKNAMRSEALVPKLEAKAKMRRIKANLRADRVAKRKGPRAAKMTKKAKKTGASNVKIVSRDGASDVTINGITYYGVKGDVSVIDDQIYADGELVDTKPLTFVNTGLMKKMWDAKEKQQAEAKEDKAYGDIRRKQMISADYRGDNLMSEMKFLEEENKRLNHNAEAWRKAQAEKQNPETTFVGGAFVPFISAVLVAVLICVICAILL